MNKQSLNPARAWPFPTQEFPRSHHPVWWVFPKPDLYSNIAKEAGVSREEAKAATHKFAYSNPADAWPKPATTGEKIADAIVDAIQHDAVNHPRHYTSHPSKIECITITEHYNFCVGNAIKYLWRAGLKDAEISSKEIEDCKKAIWYIQRQIESLEKKKNASS